MSDHAWEKMPGEPEEAFKQFLLYLGIGPERTLQAAYQTYAGEKFGLGMGKAAEVPASWKSTAKQWEWERRASAFNTNFFVTRGIAASYNHLALIAETIEKLHQHVRDNFADIVKKLSVPQLMEAIDVLSQHIPTIQQAQQLQSAVGGAGSRAIAGPSEPALRDGPDFVREGSVEDRIHLGRNGDGSDKAT